MGSVRRQCHDDASHDVGHDVAVSADIEPGICPICGSGNACGLVAGASTCWCFTTPIPPAALARVPDAARDRSCICQACAMSSTTFTATVFRDGAICYIPVPFDPTPVFGKVRAPVSVTLNGYTFRSTLAAMGGPVCVPLRKSHREAAGLEGGETLQVQLALDTAPREVETPADLKKALKAVPGALAAWDALSFTHQREHVEAIESAAKPETRARRIDKAVAMVAARAAQATSAKPAGKPSKSPSTARSGGTHTARARTSPTTSKP
jgi:hypothetical protein